MDVTTIKTMKVAELREKLKNLNLDTTGIRADLQKRLLQHFKLTEDVDEAMAVDSEEEFVEAVTSNDFQNFSHFTLRDVKDSVSYFDGSKPKIAQWLMEFQDCALAVQWNNQQKFIYAKQLLKGAASMFIRGQSNINSWNKLKAALESEFSDSLSTADIHKILSKRKKRFKESYLEYLYSIIDIAKPIKLEEKSIIDYFIEGVPDSKQNKSILYNANTINDLKEKIKIYEKIKTRSDQQYQKWDKTETTSRSENVYSTKKCIHCPSMKNHDTENCKKVKNICGKCKQMGHWTSHCNNQRPNQTWQNKNKNYRPHNNDEGPSTSKNGITTSKTTLKASINIYKRLKVNEYEFHGLLDTGSDVCMIEEALVKEFNTPIREDSIRIAGIGAGGVLTKGSIRSKVEVDGEIYEWVFHIVNNGDLGVKCIIGNDILNDVNMTITSEGSKFTPKQKTNINNSTNNNEEKNQEQTSNNNENLTTNNNNADLIKNHNNTNSTGNNNENNSTESKTINNNFMIQTAFSALCNAEENFQESQFNIEHLDSSDKSQLLKIINNYKPNKTESSEVEMKIVLKDDTPIFHRPRRLPLVEQKIVEQQIFEWLKAGIIQPSYSEYSSPIVLVQKKDGTKRLCCDYRKINKQIIRDNFPMMLIDDALSKLVGAKIFSTLDLKNGFLHVNIEENSRKYTSFVTHEGQYEFLKVPFGLTNSPAVFCRFISAIFHDLIQNGTIIIYMDDIIIPAKSISENLEKLSKVLEIASKHGLQINWKKCQFLQTKVLFLGYNIQNSEIKPSEEKVKAVKNYNIPNDQKALQRFLGLTSYFRRFIKNYATIAKPLTNLMTKNAKFKMDDDEIIAFEELKVALVNAPILKIFNENAYTEVHTDASIHGYGAMLLQKDSTTQQMHPIEFMSRKTQQYEQKYHSYELEVLAVVQALKKWRPYLLGRKFKIITDCNAFVGTVNKKEVPLRVTRWIMFLQDFEYEVEHRSGTKMRHVDALSRVHALLAKSSMTEKIIAAQNEDVWINLVKKCLLQAPEPEGDLYLKNNVLYKNKNKELIVIPEAMETEIIELAHRQGHYSSKKTAELVEKSFYIPDLHKKCEKIVKCCVPCIMTEVKAGKKEGLMDTIPKPSTPLDTLHIDHVGPMETTKKLYNYVFTVVDAFTKFTWIYPTRSTSAEECLEKLQKHAAVFGYPKSIVSDRGTAFTAHKFRQYCEENNIKHHLITTGVPRENGQVERINKTVITILTKLCQENPTHWYKHVDKVQQFINSTPPRSTKVSPFKLLTGIEMKLPGIESLKTALEEELINELNNERDEIRMLAKENINKIQIENKNTFNKNRIKEKLYKIGDLVAIKRTQFGTGLKLKPRYLGPYKVTHIYKSKKYEVEKVGEHEGPNKTTTIAEYMKPFSSAFGTNT